jgi:hypothetical protein
VINQGHFYRVDTLYSEGNSRVEGVGVWYG